MEMTVLSQDRCRMSDDQPLLGYAQRLPRGLNQNPKSLSLALRIEKLGSLTLLILTTPH